MTGRDPMPFGKYKGISIDDVDESYLDWLVEQDWLKDKWPKLHLLLTVGEKESSTEDERKVISAEGPLLDPMPPAFKAFWKRAYGERMRVHGQLNYIAFLRVAVETWKEATSDARNATGITPPRSLSGPEANARPMLPPPLSHIPAPNLDPLKQDLSKQNTQLDDDEDRPPAPPTGCNDGRDETINF